MAIPCVKFNSMQGLCASLLSWNLTFLIGLTLHKPTPHQQIDTSPLSSHLPSTPPSRHTVQLPTPLPSPVYHAISPFHHHDPSHRHLHPPPPHQINTNDQYQPDDHNNNNISSFSTIRPTTLDPSTRPDSRRMSDTAHGVLALRPSARLHTRSGVPAGEPGDAAEREQSASGFLWGQWQWIIREHAVCGDE